MAVAYNKATVLYCQPNKTNTATYFYLENFYM